MPALEKDVSRSRRRILNGAILLTLLAGGLAFTARFCRAQDTPAQQHAPQAATAKSASQPTRKTFSSAEDAATALYQAARNNDEKSILVILGPGARDIVMWTDNADDRKADADVFAKKYDEMHRLVKEPDNETTLYVGAENWPLPIPLVEQNGAWYFDADLGRQEILYRRIGENEMNTIDTLRALSMAEHQYYDSAGSGSEYSPRFASEAGKHDGLYWPDSNEDESPIGPYLAQADYSQTGRKPLHGYYYRMLTEQGPMGPGGAQKYLADGKMTGGFAFVAFPAAYRSSGVKAFIVCQNGMVYEKDLGRSTTSIASTMTAFNPDQSWTRVP
jgi:Protein of unknown function (DUF2950)